jgi:hypothetical protein
MPKRKKEPEAGETEKVIAGELRLFSDSVDVLVSLSDANASEARRNRQRIERALRIRPPLKLVP